jgi:hypothetical protein
VTEFPASANGPSCVAGVTVADPLLGPLANNGGFGATHAPQAGSHVVNSATCLPAVVPTDQRGVSRPASGTACDRGSVEVVAPLPASAATDYFTVNPCRLVDTRLVSSPTAGAPLTCGLTQAFTVGGACGVPSDAVAVSANVAVTQPTDPGTLNVFPAGTAPPLTAVVNYAENQTRANNAVLRLNAAGQVAAYCGPSGTTHVIIDVTGYFR